MSGWIYLIRNGELYKIGITKHVNNRMRQLKPDELIVKSYISNYKELEKNLHRRYSNVRIPQTEYFRLNKLEVSDCKTRIILNIYFDYFLFSTLLRISSYILTIFTLVIILNYFIYYDWRIVISNSLNLTEKVSFLFMLISFIKRSGERLNFLYEFLFRLKRVIIYLLFTFLLNFISHISQYYLLE